MDPLALSFPDDAVVVVATLTALAGSEAAVHEATRVLARAVREREDGNLLFVAHKGADVPGAVTFYEVFADRVAFEAHKSSDHLADWLKAIRGATAADAIDVRVSSPPLDV